MKLRSRRQEVVRAEYAGETGLRVQQPAHSRKRVGRRRRRRRRRTPGHRQTRGRRPGFGRPQGPTARERPRPARRAAAASGPAVVNRAVGGDEHFGVGHRSTGGGQALAEVIQVPMKRDDDRDLQGDLRASGPVAGVADWRRHAERLQYHPCCASEASITDSSWPSDNAALAAGARSPNSRPAIASS